MDHDTPQPIGQTLTVEEADALLAEGGGLTAWPANFNGKRPVTVRVENVVESYASLTAEDVRDITDHLESGTTLGVRAPPLSAIRHTHHRLAQLLSMGMDETKAAKLCNYTYGYVSVLKADPAFQELLAYYTKGVDEEFADFVSAASDLSLDMMGRLREVLETSPEKLSPTHLMEAIKLLADRSGHAPVAKSINLNVNADMAQRLNAARSRRQLTIQDEDAA